MFSYRWVENSQISYSRKNLQVHCTMKKKPVVCVMVSHKFKVCLIMKYVINVLFSHGKKHILYTFYCSIISLCRNLVIWLNMYTGYVCCSNTSTEITKTYCKFTIVCDRILSYLPYLR